MGMKRNDAVKENPIMRVIEWYTARDPTENFAIGHFKHRFKGRKLLIRHRSEMRIGKGT